MSQDIQAGKIECIIVKDISRLGRDYINVGYYLEILFPSNGVRFVSINDQFDTIDGITNPNKEVPVQSSIRIPLINLFNEQVSVEPKKRVEAILDMKTQHGEFIGPRAPFGYKNLERILISLLLILLLRLLFKKSLKWQREPEQPVSKIYSHQPHVHWNVGARERKVGCRGHA